MSRTSSRRRLSAAFVLIALLGLSLPASAMGREERVPGFLSWFQDWAAGLWSILAPESPQHPATHAIEMDGVSNPDRGILIDPNGTPGSR
jgi:hypothetical protein